jgi:two-component system, OmpR family, aerobic respiration control protein ArcA
MKPEKMDTRELVQRIERLTRERMTEREVVALSDVRRLKTKKNPPSLLIIEDDETIRAALRRIFESEGYRVRTAADGTQLADVLDGHPIDLMILDIGLPWINGFELAEMMKAHEDLKSIPLIFVSGRTSDADIKRGFEVGADDFIKKPFDLEKIKKTVSTLIQLNSI